MKRRADGERVARAIEVRGVVQGVGFRPFVWRLADRARARRDASSTGPARSRSRSPARRRRSTSSRAGFASDAPPRARVEEVDRPGRRADRSPPGSGFTIEESEAVASTERLFPPDIATCDDCLRELFDPTDRRYRYPFTNCTNCGPRATIIDDLPYDRARTSACASSRSAPPARPSTAIPANRRFHAEPVACPDCGPQLSYRRPGDAAPAARREEALPGRAGRSAGRADRRRQGAGRLPPGLRRHRSGGRGPAARSQAPLGQAVRGHGPGRGRRPARLAEMSARGGGAADVAGPADRARGAARGSGAAAGRSPTASSSAEPERARAALNRRVGLFLPYTPLHHLLLEGLGRPIVLTSGNLSDEPLATDDAEALERLSGIADSFLAHDREIRARYDDSVTRVVDGRESLIRRGRGYAPEPLDLPIATPEPLSGRRRGAEAHLHPGPRRARPRRAAHRRSRGPADATGPSRRTWRTCERLLDLEPAYVAHDLHPALPLDAVRGRATSRRAGASACSTTTPTWPRPRPRPG